MKFIEQLDNMKVKMEMNETINGVRSNFKPKTDSFLKAKPEKVFENSNTKEFTEKIYEIEDLSVADKSIFTNSNKNDKTKEKLTIIESRNRKPLFVNANSANFHSKSRRSELQTISPVIEEKESKEDSDTASEVSDIPTDDDNDHSEEKNKASKICHSKASFGDTNISNHPIETCSTNLFKEPDDHEQKENEQKDTKENGKSLREEESKQIFSNTTQSNQTDRSYDYSSYEEETESSSYSSNTSSYASSTSTSRAATVNTNKSEKLIERLQEKSSPENSLLQATISKETKTTDKNTKEVSRDTTRLEEEIKEEFERKHKYISNKNSYIIKKSPEDSGFESFQQSSVEQNSNQDSDEDNVMHTFDTVMEVENETSNKADENNDGNLELDAHHGNDHMQDLFERAEQARINAKRFREQSSNQLGLHLTTISCQQSSQDKIEEDLETNIVFSGCQIDSLIASDNRVTSHSIIDKKEKDPPTQMPKV